MLLILTHENSDFDAVASQWAARRLFPEGVPLLSRRLNRNVNQFLTLYWGAFRFQRPGDWRRQKVAEVLLVDTHALPSVRGLKPHTAVRVFDHHDEPETHREGWDYHFEPVGATTTFLVEMIQAAGLKLSTEEATLFLLGVYEDTGNLTYDTTTPRDIRAAAWLLERGADLPMVRRFMQVPLTSEQQKLYERLLASGEWLTIEGHSILVAVAEGPRDFEDEISSVVSRLRDALMPPAMFVLVALPHRVHLVARSGEEAIDVSDVAAAFGGGGHSRAAAATLHNASLQGTRAELIDYLQRTLQPVLRVHDLMSHHVKTIQATERVTTAAEEMQRHGHEGYPVVDADGVLVGLLTRRLVDRAMRHELGHLPVGQIMRAGRVTVRPSDSITRLQEIMVEEAWGQVPVVDEEEIDRLIGIVTRTDVLQTLLRREKKLPRSNLADRLERAFDPAVWRLITAISEASAGLRLPIYFVGGLVRDVLLGQRPVDIDIVTEGDAIHLVRWLVDHHGGKVYTHARFGTAKWILADEVWQAINGALPPAPDDGEGSGVNAIAAIDFVTARTEFYEEPTVLPTVMRGAIKLDLLRRDFTINTLAIRLDGAHLGELLDFYGGLRDLEQGIIRVLHSLSFIDDPTRILRAVRFEQRLGFIIDPRSMELLRGSIDLLPKVTGARLWNELQQGLAESEPAAVMTRLEELGVFTRLQPGLGWEETDQAAFAAVPGLLEDPIWWEALPRSGVPGLYLLIWLAGRERVVQKKTVNRFRLSREMASTLEGVHRLLGVLAGLPADAAPAEVEKRFRPFASFPAVPLAARARVDGNPAAELLENYWRTWRHVRTALTGHDLRDLGLPPGPRYAEILDRLLAARLDGLVEDEAGERALLQEILVADKGNL